MHRILTALLAGAFLMTGCGSPQPPTTPAPAAAAPTETAAAAPASPEEEDEESGAVTELPKRDVGPYKVSAIYVGDISDGHFNFQVTGGELKALRSWVGDEAATGALITKANWEDDHYCAHIEMPATIPDGAALWFEIESTDGKLEKSSMPLAVKASAVH